MAGHGAGLRDEAHRRSGVRSPRPHAGPDQLGSGDAERGKERCPVQCSGGKGRMGADVGCGLWESRAVRPHPVRVPAWLRSGHREWPSAVGWQGERTGAVVRARRQAPARTHETCGGEGARCDGTAQHSPRGGLVRWLYRGRSGRVASDHRKRSDGDRREGVPRAMPLFLGDTMRYYSRFPWHNWRHLSYVLRTLTYWAICLSRKARGTWKPPYPRPPLGYPPPWL